jgi:hypothetical protein
VAGVVPGVSGRRNTASTAKPVAHDALNRDGRTVDYFTHHLH